MGTYLKSIYKLGDKKRLSAVGRQPTLATPGHGRLLRREAPRWELASDRRPPPRGPPGCLHPECSRATLLLEVGTEPGSLRRPLECVSWAEVLGANGGSVQRALGTHVRPSRAVPGSRGARRWLVSARSIPRLGARLPFQGRLQAEGGLRLPLK